MKFTHSSVIGLSLMALAACRSSAPEPREQLDPAEVVVIDQTAGSETIEEAVVADTVPALKPEVRYYEIADT